MDTATTFLLTLVAQVSAIAVIGILLSSLLHWRPGLSRCVLAATLLATCLLTVASCLPPLPNLAPETIDANSPQAQAELHAPAGGTSDLPAVSETPTADFGQLLSGSARAIRSLSQYTQPPVQLKPVVRPVTIIFTLIVAVGLLRLAASVFYTRQILSTAVELNESHAALRLNTLVSKARQTTGHDRFQVDLRQSSQSNDAALVGLLRPTIVLPADWSGWSDSELDSVLAHELGHMLARDTLWRMTSVFVTAIHFYNPLVHWLAGRYALAQELLADEAAAQLVGGRNYLRSLSRLALRRDKQHSKQIAFSSAGMNPVFSGYLIRRIEMLMKRNTKWRPTESRLSKGIAVAAVFSTAGLLMVARGIAQTDDTAGSTPTKVASLPKKDQLVTPDPTAALFDREPANVDVLPPNQTGFVDIKMAHIVRSYETETTVKFANALLSSVLTKELQTDQPVKFDLNKIDSLIGELSFRVGYKPEAEDGKRHYIAIGSTGVRTSLTEPFSIGKWFEDNSPTGCEQIDGKQTFTLSTLASVAGVPLAVSQADDRTLCFGGLGGLPPTDKPEEIAQAFSEYAATPNDSAWASTLPLVDGGLLTAVITDAKVDAPLNTEEASSPAAEKFARVVSSFKTAGIGLDLSADLKTVGIRIAVECEDTSAADLIQADIQGLLEEGYREIDRDDDALTNRLALQALTRAQVTRETKPNGSVFILLRSSCDNPRPTAAQLFEVLKDEFGG